jgi:hypothetical protein
MQPGPRRGVLGGAILVAVGTPFLLQAVNVPNASAYLFVTLGLAFLAAWYLGTKQYVYLVPASVLIGFGLGLVIPTWLPLPVEAAAPVFLGALALGLLVVFIAHPNRPIFLIPAGVLAVVAVVDMFTKVQLVPSGLQPFFVPIVLIAVGVYLLVEPRTH